MSIIYILKLEENKYYVGRTKNINNRVLEHFTNNGSEWTKKYKPVEIINEYKGDNFDEEKHTLLTMEKYGINNVRGGSYCKIELTEIDIQKAQQTIYSIQDKCYKCGVKGHYAKECEKIQLLNNPNKLEEYIRIKLGQTIFPTPKYKDYNGDNKKVCKDCKECKNRGDCENCKNCKIGDDIYKWCNRICNHNKCHNYYSNNWKEYGHLRFEYDAQKYNKDIEHNKKVIELFNDFYKNKKCILHTHEGCFEFLIVSNEDYNKYDYYNGDTRIYRNFPYIEILNPCCGNGTVAIIRDLILYINKKINYFG